MSLDKWWHLHALTEAIHTKIATRNVNLTFYVGGWVFNFFFFFFFDVFTVANLQYFDSSQNSTVVYQE